MSGKFQMVLYYSKKIVIGGKPSIDSFIESKKKLANVDEINIDSILDEYNANKASKGREELVNTWALIYDDENFIESILEVEQSEGFVEWDSRSDEIIKQKMVKISR